MLIKRLFVFCSIAGQLIWFADLMAQTDSTYALREALVEVRSEKVLTRLEGPDLITNHRSMSQLASDQLAGVVKANGAGALASFSIRGGTPEQSSVFWNGVSLQNNTNGVVDLNLLPALVFDEISLNAFHSTGRGSGSIAGSMNLANKDLSKDSLIELHLMGGSFGTFTVSTTLNYRTGRFQNQTRFGLQSAVNNYTYPSVTFPINGEIDTLHHAKTSQNVLLHQSRIVFKRANPITMRLWWQSNEREIPATMLEVRSNKAQTDQALRTQAVWSTPFLTGNMEITGAWFQEHLNYRDYDTFDYTSNNTTLLAHYVKSLLPGLSFGVDVEGRLFQADGDTFYNQTRSEISGATHARWRTGRFAFNAGQRLASYTHFKTSPLLYHLECGYGFSDRLQLTAKANSNYRVPTFNNLFWRPGGNILLIPERSHQQELELHGALNKMSWQLNVYSTLITNQIQWILTSKGYFEALQMTEARRWNRGIEIEFGHEHKTYRQKLKINLCRSGNWEAGTSPAATQQVFIPIYQLNHFIEYKRDIWSLQANNQFISKRFIDAGNLEFLDPVWLTHIAGGVSVGRLKATLSVRNVFNTSYQMLPYRPMAPRYFEIGLHYSGRVMGAGSNKK